MDLLRRRAAGELCRALVGAGGPRGRPGGAGLPPPGGRAPGHRAARRRRARAARGLHRGRERRARGRSRRRPFEYLLLRADAAVVAPEDSLLCALTMYLTSQSQLPRLESTLELMHDILPPELVAFLAPRGTEWDAPLEGEPFAQPEIPGPEVLDLRRGRRAPSPGASGTRRGLRSPAPRRRRGGGGPRQQQLGGGRHAHRPRRGAARQRHAPRPRGAQHLVPRVPRVPGGRRRADGSPGSRCPGCPSWWSGSNGHVAWGFTNSQGDWADLVVLEPDPQDPEALPHARGTAEARARDGDDPRARAARTRRSRCSRRSGVRSSTRTTGAAAGRCAGCRSSTGGVNAALVAHGGGPTTSRRPSTSPPRWGSPTRTSCAPTPPAASAGRSSGAFPAVWASTGGGPRRGPTAPGAGTAGSAPRSTPASSTRRAAGSGPPTPGW